MRHRLPLLRGARRAPAGRRSGGHSAARELHPLSAHRPGARRHALEFSLLAGLPLPRAGADGGQRGPAQARLQRAAVRARHRRHRAPRRIPRGRISDAADRRDHGAARDRRSARQGRHPHRQRAGGPQGGGAGRQADQEDRAGTGRQRSLHRDAQRRSRRRRAHRGAGARHQQRPKLHRRQALHRGRSDRRRVRAAVRGGDGPAGGRRPDAGGHAGRSAGHARHPPRSR